MTSSGLEKVRSPDSDRRAAIAAGVIFIIATAGSIASVPLLPDLKAVDFLSRLPANANQMTGAVLLLLVAAFGSAGIAVALYPVMRRWDAGLALASVVFRTMEGVFYVVGVMFLLSLLTLSRAGNATDPATLQAIGDALRSSHDHASLLGVFCFCIGALSYYVLFFQSRLVPRWLSGAGVVAIALMFAACILALINDSPITGYVYLALPIALQEMVLAVWLIVRGFDSSALNQPRFSDSPVSRNN